jgi:hypothetical protein
MLMHVDGEDGRHDTGQERDELAGELPQDDAWVLVARKRVEGVDARRQLDVAAFHRLEEELLFRFDVTEECSRSDVQLPGNVGQRGGLEALLREDAARRGEQLRSLDGCRPAHL